MANPTTNANANRQQATTEAPSQRANLRHDPSANTRVRVSFQVQQPDGSWSEAGSTDLMRRGLDNAYKSGSLGFSGNAQVSIDGARHTVSINMTEPKTKGFGIPRAAAGDDDTAPTAGPASRYQ
jgi:hypothetical protein